MALIFNFEGLNCRSAKCFIGYKRPLDIECNYCCFCSWCWNTLWDHFNLLFFIKISILSALTANRRWRPVSAQMVNCCVYEMRRLMKDNNHICLTIFRYESSSPSTKQLHDLSNCWPPTRVPVLVLFWTDDFHCHEHNGLVKGWNVHFY